MPNRIAKVERVAQRLGMGLVDDLSDILRDKVIVALEMATLRLESIIMTEFARTSVVDTYWVDSKEQPWVDQFPKLRLSRGFVFEADPPLTIVRTAFNLVDLPSGDVEDATAISQEKTKGLLLLTQGVLGVPGYRGDHFGRDDKFYARVEYDAGFLTVSDCLGNVYTGIPEWLEVAGIELAVDIYRNSGPCEDGDSEAQFCPKNLLPLIDRHIRHYPSALRVIQ